MTQSIVSSLPVDSRFVPSCLESIIDKKVRKVALNLLEKIVDWLFTWFYCPYHSLYKKKMARVHLFSDSITPLFDATRRGIAGICRHQQRDYISLNNRKVYFSPNPNIEIHFSRQAYTDYVVVRDDRRRPGYFHITEQELSRPGNRNPMEKTWAVNTRDVFPDGPNQPTVHRIEQPRHRLSL